MIVLFEIPDEAIPKQQELISVNLTFMDEILCECDYPFDVVEQRTGHWIPTGYDGYADGNPVYDWWECSECGWEHTGDEDTLTTYCPNCGAKCNKR